MGNILELGLTSMESWLLNVCLTIVILLTSGYLVASEEEDLSALKSLLSPRLALKRRAPTETFSGHDGSRETPVPEEDEQNWTKWSDWSTCSSSTMPGFRVRSRICPKEAKCPGNDVNLIKCNEHAGRQEGRRYEFSEKYIKKCKELGPEMSLSCKLYLENPDLAYDIFSKNSCFFTGNDEDESSQTNQTVPIPPSPGTGKRNSSDSNQGQFAGDTRDIIPINSNDGTKFRSDNLLPKSRKWSAGADEDEKEGNSYTNSVIHALIAEKKCKAKCSSTMLQATRLWALGTRFARSAESTINILNRNTRLSKGIGVMFFEYNSCVDNCYTIGSTHRALSGRARSQSDEQPRDLMELLLSLKEEQAVTSDTESLCGGGSPACAVIPRTEPQRTERRRSKRGISERYESPCFSVENQVPKFEIERKGGAELFYYESHFQRFNHRKCEGLTKRDNNELFLPKERVRQQNGDLAYCKQGFLTRYGLFIIRNPRGKYYFSDGERFSIESRTFQVESHCEIVIMKKPTHPAR